MFAVICRIMMYTYINVTTSKLGEIDLRIVECVCTAHVAHIR